MTEQENIKNMNKCHNFGKCNIPLCPLDFYMKERTELPEDKRCVLRRVNKTKRVEGKMTQAMKGILKFIYKRNLKT